MFNEHSQNDLNKASDNKVITRKELSENYTGHKPTEHRCKRDLPGNPEDREFTDSPFQEEDNQDDVDESNDEYTKDMTRAKRRKANAKRKAQLLKKAYDARRGAKSRFKRDEENHNHGCSSLIGRTRRLCQMVERLTNKQIT